MQGSERKLRKDTRAESVFMPFVMIIGMVLVLGFVINGLMQYAVSGQVSQGIYPSTTNPFGLYNYTTIAAYDTGDPRYVDFGDSEGYLISDADVLDEVPYPTDDDPFTFVDEDGDVKYVHIIRNNADYDPESTDIWEMYQDFIAVRRHTSTQVIGAKWYDAAIPFQTIEDNFDEGSNDAGLEMNVSITDFRLGKSQDSLFINTTIPGESAFISALWDNEFYLQYGWSLFRLEEVDFWGAISMILYEEIPGVHPVINFFLHAFILGTIVFVVFTMAVRMTPFLGGG